MLRRSIVILALAGLCLSPVAVAQEGSRTVGQSLSERISSLRNVFKRNNTPATQRSESNDSNRPRPPMPYDPADLEREQQAARPIVPQVTPPKRVATTMSRGSERRSESRSASRSESRSVRRSPVASSRDAELDEALADLLAPTPRPAAKRETARRTPMATVDEVPDYLEGLVDENDLDGPLFDGDSPDLADDAEMEPVDSPANEASQEPSGIVQERRNPFDLHRALAREQKVAAVAAAKPAETPQATQALAAQQAEVADEQPTVDIVAAPRGNESSIETTPVEVSQTNDLRPQPEPQPEPQPATIASAAETTENNADEPTQWQETVAARSPEASVAVDGVAIDASAAQGEAFPQQADESTRLDATAIAARAPAEAEQGATFLTSQVQPLIRSHVEGPRQVVVGRSASFVVRLGNTGQTAAEALTATVAIPAWADVVEASPSSGVVQHASTADGAHSLQWRLSKLDVADDETLTLQLIPRSGQPLRLAVQWTHAPVGTTATVEVREPKLNIAITGPGDVLFGKPQRYRLLLTNPGNGLAEGVTIRLTPPGGSEADVIEHPVGDLAAGAKHDVELELVAREAGDLTVEASAVAMGGLEAATIKHVTCRKPELQLDWRGPDKKYAGTVATYYFRVRNPGAAATEDLVVDVQLPAGAELIAASEGHKQLNNGLVRWQGMPLTPGEQRFMQLRCKLNRPGANQVTATASCDAIDLSDAKTFATHVVALADLKLEVADPKGPVPVGEEALYTVRVVNRGTTAASNVNVVAMFSAGIDPTVVEGAEHAVEDGRVAFRPITSLPAGQHVELRIRAQAGQPGTHVFRTEVVCADLDTKLAAEETTRFFVDEQRWDDPSRAYSTAAKATDDTQRR